MGSSELLWLVLLLGILAYGVVTIARDEIFFRRTKRDLDQLMAAARDPERFDKVLADFPDLARRLGPDRTALLGQAADRLRTHREC